MAKLYNFGLVKGWANRDLVGASEYVMNLEGGDEVAKLVGILADQHNQKEDFSRLLLGLILYLVQNLKKVLL